MNRTFDPTGSAKYPVPRTRGDEPKRWAGTWLRPGLSCQRSRLVRPTSTIPRDFTDQLAMTLEWVAASAGVLNPEAGRKLVGAAAELRGHVEVGDGEATQV